MTSMESRNITSEMSSPVAGAAYPRAKLMLQREVLSAQSRQLVLVPSDQRSDSRRDWNWSVWSESAPVSDRSCPP
eukprot:CAMPEP_0180322548 /NCGR_PEP_ID=MMETSP0988-20121125/36790_1 /TAXON_ID=697907 /ORGANISM="non described non described, Strain CCMP2293" /LENGTH=74 /DNA_ID=CAMNT_0022308599 /DNA_START=340 /DNA_END=560 /DNA_ORIENTATION=+